MGELRCLIYSFLSSVAFSWGICSYMFGNSSGRKTMKWVTLLKDFKEKVGLSQPPASAPSTPSPPPQRDRISSSSSINANDLSPTSPDYWSLPSRLDFDSTEELWPSSYFPSFFFCWHFICFTLSFSLGNWVQILLINCFGDWILWNILSCRGTKNLGGCIRIR